MHPQKFFQIIADALAAQHAAMKISVNGWGTVALPRMRAPGDRAHKRWKTRRRSGLC